MNKKAGQLYFKGNSLNTVRTVNDFKWKNIFTDNSGGEYPYHASNLPEYLKDGIKGKIDTSKETVEKVAIEVSENEHITPQINGVLLSSIYDAYNSDKTKAGFGGSCGYFNSCWLSTPLQCEVWHCETSGFYSRWINDYEDQSTLISRTFESKSTEVYFDANGGISGSIRHLTAGYDSSMPTITGKGALPTRKGYTFEGYFDAAEGGTQYYNADGTSARTWDKKGVKLAILYAHWKSI